MAPAEVFLSLVCCDRVRALFMMVRRRNMMGTHGRVLALAGALLWSATGAATTVIQPSLERMSQRADVIVHAVVEDQTVTPSADGKRILTLSRLRVMDAIKGAKPGDTLTLYQVGGRLGQKVMNVVGVSSFKVGEEVVLFAETFVAHEAIKAIQTSRVGQVPAETLHPSGTWVVQYAVGIGKFAVRRDTPNVPMATEELGDVASVARVGNQTVMVPLVSTHQPLDVFKSEVRRMAVGSAP
jgi:hypothetical protein